MRNIRTIYLMLVVAAAAMWGCEKSDPKCPVYEWQPRTVIVYLAVDNNFSHEGQEKIDMLTAGWNRNFEGNLLIYSDPGGNPQLIQVYYDQATGRNANRVVKTYIENTNSADPALMGTVLNDVKYSWPSDSYGMVLLSHATGWLPAEVSVSNPRSVLEDRGRSMDLQDFVAGLPYKLDFAIFDACFMANVEVAYQMKDKVAYLVASPAEVWQPGFVYTSMMTNLFNEDLEAGLKAVAREFYDSFEATGYYSATVSVIKTSGLEAVATFMKPYLENVDGYSQVDLSQIQSFGYRNHNLYTDMGDYLQKLNTGPGLYDQLMAVVDDCVIYSAHTSYYRQGYTGAPAIPINVYTGLTIYVPRPAFPVINSMYKTLAWTQRVGTYVPETN